MFGIRHRRIVVVYTLGETTHEDTGTVYRITDDKALDIERQYGDFGREPRPLWLHRDDATHIYPVGSIARLELGHETDDSQARVELWQATRTGDLFLRDPDTHEAWVCQTTNEDHRKTAQFGPDAHSLLEGETNLAAVSGADRSVILDGLEHVATYRGRHGSITLELRGEGGEPLAGPLAHDYIGDVPEHP